MYAAGGNACRSYRYMDVATCSRLGWGCKYKHIRKLNNLVKKIDASFFFLFATSWRIWLRECVQQPPAVGVAHVRSHLLSFQAHEEPGTSCLASLAFLGYLPSCWIQHHIWVNWIRKKPSHIINPLFCSVEGLHKEDRGPTYIHRIPSFPKYESSFSGRSIRPTQWIGLEIDWCDDPVIINDNEL